MAACTLVACILWCLEPWQRPEFLRNLPDAILLSTACLGILALAVMTGLRVNTARRWRWMMVLGVCGFALLGSMRMFFGSLALSNLENQIHKNRSSLWVTSEIPPKSISEKLVGIFESVRLGVPDWLSKHVRQQRQSAMAPTPESLIASSRLPLRRALADSMVRNNSHAELLLEYWKYYFPAIIGADVKLEIRREWMIRLHAMRQDVSLGDHSHQAAIFCMALIVLTDPPEFEKWRIPVRDAMLGWGKPSVSLAWMRTIDTLLALDPPESWIGLTKPLTANHDLFRSAMAVPVRGIAGHIEALSREFEFFEGLNDFDHAAEFWSGAGASLDAWPAIFGKSETAKIRNWQRDIAFQRLVDSRKKNYAGLCDSRASAWLKFTPEQQQQLTATAADRARQTCKEIAAASGSANGTVLANLSSIRQIHPYLTKDQQTEISRLLIPVMLRPDLFHETRSSRFIRFDNDWVKWLWKIQPLMTADEQKILQTALKPLMGNLNSNEPTSAILLCLDAWSDMPTLSPEMWLAQVWPSRSEWRIVPRNTPRESLDPFADAPLPVPPLADSVVKTLATHLDAAYSTGNEMTFAQTLNLDLKGDDPSPRPSRVITYTYFNYREIKNWQSYGLLSSHSLAELLEMRLYLRGLRVIDKNGLRALKKLMKNDRDLYWWWSILNRSGNLVNPWNDAEADPQEVVRWLGQPNLMLLPGMLNCIEKFPTDAAIIRAICDELRRRAQTASIEKKTEIFGTLFRLSRGLPRDERLAMRRDFLTAYHTKRFKSSWYDENLYDYGPPLTYIGGGLGIPWEDDELSAELSWRSNIERQVHLCPLMKIELSANDVFSFLEFGSDRKWEFDSWKEKTTTMPRLSAPFEPTPWQRARELHLRRPDLDIK